MLSRNRSLGARVVAPPIGIAYKYARRRGAGDVCGVRFAPPRRARRQFPQYLSSGTYHACALLTKSSDGSKVVKCWGLGSEGQMMNGATANIGDTGGAGVVIPEVDLASSDGATNVRVHCGGRFTCVVFSNSRLKCFGYGTQYSLGYRTATNTASTETIGDDPGEMGTALGYVTPMGTVLGYVPLGVDKNGAEHEVAGICIGNGACVMSKETGQTKTGWGKSKFIYWSKDNSFGQYGPTDAPQRSMYQGQGGVSGQDRVTAPLWEMDFGNDVDNVTPLTVTKCSQTQAHTCVILSNGDLRCFGYNAYGQLGLGISDQTAKIRLLASDLTDANKVVDLGDTEGHGTGTKYTAKEFFTGIGGGTCAIRSDDKVVCWGSNSFGCHGLNGGRYWNGGATKYRGLGTSESLIGNNLVISQLGAGGSTSYTAAKFGASYGADINSNANSVCVIMTDGTAKCLGSKWLAGQDLRGVATEWPFQWLGATAGEMATLGFINFGGDTVETITIGYDFACAIMSDLETIRCWGRNTNGQLGLGTTDNWGVHPSTNPMANLPAKVLVGSGYKSATPGPCVASGVITNGAASPCTSSLAGGASCTPTCNSGYTLSGTRSCSAGTLTDTAACTANACVATTSSSDDGSDGNFRTPRGRERSARDDDIYWLRYQ
jgi:alpha-tubulin suppressor-like RCC1 family protein